MAAVQSGALPLLTDFAESLQNTQDGAVKKASLRDIKWAKAMPPEAQPPSPVTFQHGPEHLSWS